MFSIQQLSVDELIPYIHFACDIEKCQGACCTMPGGLGAPLLLEELEQLEITFPIIKNDLPNEHLNTIAQYGLYENRDNSYTTMCYNNGACVFVTYENNIARCSIEKAYKQGKLNWQKPISCHLFPIRVNNDNKYLHYEKISECQSALANGEDKNIYLTEFLKEPIIRAFGYAWYNEFQNFCKIARQKVQIKSFCIGD